MKRYDMSEIRAALADGQNIVNWVRRMEDTTENSAAALLYAYDAQAGSYVALLRDPGNMDVKLAQASKLAGILDELSPSSILDAGTGEATTFAATLQAMQQPPRWAMGFDISLSRLLHARAHLESAGLRNVKLAVAQLENIPFPDKSVDTVVTFHAVEPNHGREKFILGELLRVAARHLVLIEPSWEFASTEMRARMEEHGYVRHLPDIIEQLGYSIARQERWELDSNPLNAAALIIVSKEGSAPATPELVSPISGKRLAQRDDCLFCAEDGHAFPVISGIPTMLVECAVLCSHLDQF